MGVGVGDYNLDGNLDIFKTHFADDTNVLYRNNGKGELRRCDDRRRPGRGDPIHRLGRRHCRSRQRRQSGPVHGDGQRVPGSRERRCPTYPMKTPRVIFRNLGNGKFRRADRDSRARASRRPHCSRGCAFGDFDNDGDIDILIVNLNEPPSLLRNDVSAAASLVEGQAGGREVEPERHRRPRDRALRRQGPGAGSAEPVELLFGERSAPAFRARAGADTPTWRSDGRTASARRSRTSPPISWW